MLLDRWGVLLYATSLAGVIDDEAWACWCAYSSTDRSVNVFKIPWICGAVVDTGYDVQ
jgi:hypothetical protein